jgi:hypothetical protein
MLSILLDDELADEQHATVLADVGSILCAHVNRVRSCHGMEWGRDFDPIIMLAGFLMIHQIILQTSQVRTIH